MNVDGVKGLLESNKALRMACDLRGAKFRTLRRFINTNKKYSNYSRENLKLRLDKIKSLCNSMESTNIEEIGKIHYEYLGYREDIVESILKEREDN